MPPILVILLVAAYAAAQAIVSLTQPAALGGFLGLGVETPLARSEIMTNYGGFYAGIAVFFAASLVRASLREGALAFLALAATGASLARLWTVAMFPLGSLTATILLAAEVVFAVLGWVGWRAQTRAKVTASL